MATFRMSSQQRIEGFRRGGNQVYASGARVSGQGSRPWRVSHGDRAPPRDGAPAVRRTDTGAVGDGCTRAGDGRRGGGESSVAALFVPSGASPAAGVEHGPFCAALRPSTASHPTSSTNGSRRCRPSAAPPRRMPGRRSRRSPAPSSTAIRRASWPRRRPRRRVSPTRWIRPRRRSPRDAFGRCQLTVNFLAVIPSGLSDQKVAVRVWVADGVHEARGLGRVPDERRQRSADAARRGDRHAARDPDRDLGLPRHGDPAHGRAAERGGRSRDALGREG